MNNPRIEIERTGGKLIISIIGNWIDVFTSEQYKEAVHDIAALLLMYNLRRIPNAVFTSLHRRIWAIGSILKGENVTVFGLRFLDSEACIDYQNGRTLIYLPDADAVSLLQQAAVTNIELDTIMQCYRNSSSIFKQRLLPIINAIKELYPDEQQPEQPAGDAGNGNDQAGPDTQGTGNV